MRSKTRAASPHRPSHHTPRPYRFMQRGKGAVDESSRPHTVESVAERELTDADDGGTDTEPPVHPRYERPRDGWLRHLPTQARDAEDSGQQGAAVDRVTAYPFATSITSPSSGSSSSSLAPTAPEKRCGQRQGAASSGPVLRGSSVSHALSCDSWSAFSSSAFGLANGAGSYARDPSTGHEVGPSVA